MSWPLSWYLLFLLDKNRYVISTLLCILRKLVWRMYSTFRITKFGISKLMLRLGCCCDVVMSNIADEVINIIIDYCYIAAFGSLCRFSLTRIFLRIEMNALFIAPFNRLWREKWIVWWGKIRGSLESMLKDKWFSFARGSLWALIIIKFSDIYLALTSFIKSIVWFRLRIILFPEL